MSSTDTSSKINWRKALASDHEPDIESTAVLSAIAYALFGIRLHADKIQERLLDSILRKSIEHNKPVPKTYFQVNVPVHRDGFRNRLAMLDCVQNGEFPDDEARYEAINVVLEFGRELYECHCVFNECLRSMNDANGTSMILQQAGASTIQPFAESVLKELGRLVQRVYELKMSLSRHLSGLGLATTLTLAVEFAEIWELFDLPGILEATYHDSVDGLIAETLDMRMSSVLSGDDILASLGFWVTQTVDYTEALFSFAEKNDWGVDSIAESLTLLNELDRLMIWSIFDPAS